MTLQIVPRSTWGARPWAPDQTPAAVPLNERRFFVVHYDGGTPVARTGFAIPRTIDNEHHAKGWAGIGYHFVVSQAGQVFEGRGWALRGAHCPGRNRDGIGVQVAVGGQQVPSDAALHAVCELYAEASRRAGRPLVRTWHGAQISTDCPGDHLVTWVRAGMPDPHPAPTPQEDDVLTADDIERIAQRVAELTTGIGARNPVIVDEGTGARELPDGRDIDAIPTVLGEVQHDQRLQAAQLRALADTAQATLDHVRKVLAIVEQPAPPKG